MHAKEKECFFVKANDPKGGARPECKNKIGRTSSSAAILKEINGTAKKQVKKRKAFEETCTQKAQEYTPNLASVRKKFLLEYQPIENPLLRSISDLIKYKKKRYLDEIENALNANPKNLLVETIEGSHRWLPYQFISREDSYPDTEHSLIYKTIGQLIGQIKIFMDEYAKGEKESSEEFRLEPFDSEYYNPKLAQLITLHFKLLYRAHDELTTLKLDDPKKLLKKAEHIHESSQFLETVQSFAATYKLNLNNEPTPLERSYGLS